MKPKFSLRDLFWLVMVCGLALGWWVEITGLRRQLGEANEKLEEAHKQMMRKTYTY